MSENTVNDPPIYMPYWSRNEFHELLKGVPFKQVDEEGVTVVNVSHLFFKMVGNDLVSALVPEDLSMPTEWEVVTDTEMPLAVKAISMLGQPLQQQ